jgi:hypothetical protein
MQIRKGLATLLAVLLWVPGCGVPHSGEGRPAQIAPEATAAAVDPASGVTIERATVDDFKSHLWLDFSDGSSAEFIGFAADRAYLQRRDRRQNEDWLRILWVYTKDLDAALVRDLQYHLGAKARKPNPSTATEP